MIKRSKNVLKTFFFGSCKFPQQYMNKEDTQKIKMKKQDVKIVKIKQYEILGFFASFSFHLNFLTFNFLCCSLRATRAETPQPKQVRYCFSDFNFLLSAHFIFPSISYFFYLIFTILTSYFFIITISPSYF